MHFIENDCVLFAEYVLKALYKLQIEMEHKRKLLCMGFDYFVICESRMISSKKRKWNLKGVNAQFDKRPINTHQRTKIFKALL